MDYCDFAKCHVIATKMSKMTRSPLVSVTSYNSMTNIDHKPIAHLEVTNKLISFQTELPRSLYSRSETNWKIYQPLVEGRKNLNKIRLQKKNSIRKINCSVQTKAFRTFRSKSISLFSLTSVTWLPLIFASFSKLNKDTVN